MQWIHDTVGLSHLVNYLEINLVLELKTSLLRIGKLLQYLSCLRSNLIKHSTCIRPKNRRINSFVEKIRRKKNSSNKVTQKIWSWGKCLNIIRKKSDKSRFLKASFVRKRKASLKMIMNLLFGSLSYKSTIVWKLEVLTWSGDIQGGRSHH